MEDLFNEGRLDRIEKYLAAGYTEHSTGAPEDIEGREAIREHCGSMQEAFSDFAVRIEELIAENDKVAQRSRQIGTHQGTFMGIESAHPFFEYFGAAEKERGKSPEST